MLHRYKQFLINCRYDRSQTCKSRWETDGCRLCYSCCFEQHSGILVASVQLFAGFVFSSAAGSMSDLLLSLCIWLYKEGRMAGPALILPALTVACEMLPIALPTDTDTVFALGVSGFSLLWARISATAMAAHFFRRH
jgi:hypothetical protein